MGDPEEEQDRLTELLNSSNSVLLGVTVTFETGSVDGEQNHSLVAIIFQRDI